MFGSKKKYWGKMQEKENKEKKNIKRKVKKNKK